MSITNISFDIIEDKKYSCFNSNPIVIIPHDLYDYTHELNKDIFGKNRRRSSISTETSEINNSSFENLKILSVLTNNWRNRIRKTLSSSKIKILKKLGIKKMKIN